MALSPWSLLLGVCLQFWSRAVAQQIPGASFPLSYPSLSGNCLNALNQTVSCPPFLPYAAINGPLSSDQLTILCNATCYDSLQTVRSGIANSCSASTDIIVDDNVSYPATYVVDNFILAYNVSCRKDSSTGEYCDVLIASWANETTETSAQICSDCSLGIQQIELDSPLGYTDGLAETFDNTTASCGATGYAFTSPTAYALNSTATSANATSTSTASSSTCTQSYTVKSGDTCTSVSLAQSVSTFSLLYYNNLNIYCNNFPGAGSTLCLPPSCTVYTVQANDTCIGVSQAKGNITATQVQAWNPNINALCGNLGRMNGTQICVSPPGGWLNTASQSNDTATTAISAAPVPTNAESGSNKDCGKWYTVQTGDDCALVSTYENIALNDFYFLNPEINSTCGNLILGAAYCVEAVGSISTYANYTNGGPTANACGGASAPASCFSSTAGYSTTSLMTGNATFSPTGTASPTSSVSLAPPTLSPTASGTISGCYTYRNYMTSNATSSNSTMSVNSCSYLSILYKTNVSSLIQWNPSLTQRNCSLQPGYSYCVQQYAPTSNATTPTPAGGLCEAINKTMPGTTKSCTCFANVYGYDRDSYDCEDLAADYNITVAQLQSWNPWAANNCTIGLYANLANSTARAVCIAANSTSSSTTTSTTAGNSAPTQSGTAPNCDAFYTVKSGDSCSAIESTYDITFTQFYDWNPSVGSNCQYLEVGVSYCVGVSGSGASSTTVTPSSTSTGGSPGAPTQSGTAADCNGYYTVQSGDSCSKIESAYDITFTQFYSWNPSVGSNCQYLDVGYAYCISVSGGGSSSPTSSSGDQPPAPTQSGVASNCDEWYTVQSGDSCSAIESEYNITFSQLYQWNPSIGSNCQYLEVGYAVCVGVS